MAYEIKNGILHDGEGCRSATAPELWAFAEIERLRAALKPFAEIALWKDTYPDADHDRLDGPDIYITVAQVRAARQAVQ